MSLKVFHIVFILASIVISVLFALWSFLWVTPEQASSSVRFMGVASAVLSLGLLCYGAYFVRRARTIII